MHLPWIQLINFLIISQFFQVNKHYFPHIFYFLTYLLLIMTPTNYLLSNSHILSRKMEHKNIMHPLDMAKNLSNLSSYSSIFDYIVSNHLNPIYTHSIILVIIPPITLPSLYFSSYFLFVKFYIINKILLYIHIYIYYIHILITSVILFLIFS